MAIQEVWLDFEKPIASIKKQIQELQKLRETQKVDTSSEIISLEKKLMEAQQEIFANLTPWQRVKLARHPNRPYTLDYVNVLFEEFTEFHGDRRFADDAAIICGPAKFNGNPVMIIGQQKGRDTKENLLRNFGMPHPEGYRKAMRMMQMADKFELPIICFIDTPGAYPGIGAEERGEAEAIAYNLWIMAALKTPSIAMIVGEGGSGGALGIGVCDRILMLENAYYSVISPEGAAAILWRDAAKAPEAAEALKITAQHLFQLGIIDEIIPEPLGGAHQNLKATAELMKPVIAKHISQLSQLSKDDLLKERYEKYRKLGQFTE